MIGRLRQVHCFILSFSDLPTSTALQCLVTEVTTEEIEDLRARMDWAVAGDTIDSSFSVEQAKTEFERIISSLDDADPQLIALVKERLKVLHMLSRVYKPPRVCNS